MPLRKIGLTGNVASGKSTVARVWEDLGAHVIDADVLAREAVEPGTEAHAAIREEWGDEVLTPEGEIDRAALRRVVFSDPAARKRLEGIVHPAVRRLRDERYAEVEREGRRFVVADIPLLFETGMQGEFDRVALVDAPEEVRRERMVTHRGMDAEEADRIIASQMPAAEKREMSDVVIDNVGSVEDLEREARQVWARLTSELEEA